MSVEAHFLKSSGASPASALTQTADIPHQGHQVRKMPLTDVASRARACHADAQTTARLTILDSIFAGADHNLHA
jgi:hypothetical protein